MRLFAATVRTKGRGGDWEGQRNKERCIPCKFVNSTCHKLRMCPDHCLLSPVSGVSCVLERRRSQRMFLCYVQSWSWSDVSSLQRHLKHISPLAPPMLRFRAIVLHVLLFLMCWHCILQLSRSLSLSQLSSSFHDFKRLLVLEFSCISNTRKAREREGQISAAPYWNWHSPLMLQRCSWFSFK